MAEKELQFPLYAKVTILLIGFLALIVMLHIAQGIIVPIIFAAALAIVLHPVVNVSVRMGMNRVVAILIVLSLTFLVMAASGALLVSQASRFSQSWPILVDRSVGLLGQTTAWAAGYFDIDPQSAHEWVAKTIRELVSTSSAAVGKTLATVGTGLVLLFLVPVYIFMMLHYQPLLLDFVRKLFGTSNQSQVSEVVAQIKTLTQRYLIGLVIEFGLVAALETGALLALRIDYAILLGIVGALLNVIPYIGGLVAVALPMMIALVTKSTAWYALYVLVVYFLIQLVDNNYIVPRIVASKVKINALFSLVAVIAGGALWGIPGMFLSIPLLAIVKLVFDHVEPLKPWGFLLGDTMPPLLKIGKPGQKCRTVSGA